MSVRVYSTNDYYEALITTQDSNTLAQRVIESESVRVQRSRTKEQTRYQEYVKARVLSLTESQSDASDASDRNPVRRVSVVRRVRRVRLLPVC